MQDDPEDPGIAKIEEIAAPPKERTVPETVLELSADSAGALELALWESVRASEGELETYLEQYPDGSFASLARTKLDARRAHGRRRQVPRQTRSIWISGSDQGQQPPREIESVPKIASE
jgi:hypothetical protein